MSPLTHLLVSWTVAAKTTNNLRDTRLVALAGILPDVDGFGLVIDMVKDPSLKQGAFYYQEYHHWLLHGLAGGLAIAILMACFGRQRWRVLLLALLTFHLHLLCDMLGSRGPTPGDLWPIYYFGPFTRIPVWMWGHQWPLEGWQNKIISITMFGVALGMAVRMGHSFVGVFNRKLDGIVVPVLRQWASRTGLEWLKPEAIHKCIGGSAQL